MKVMAVSVLLIAPLVAIAAVEGAIAQTQVVQFQCQEGGSFEIHPRGRREGVELKLPSGQTKTLLPVDSLIGKKFSDGKILLYVNEQDAWIDVKYTRQYDACRAQPATSSLSPTQ